MRRQLIIASGGKSNRISAAMVALPHDHGKVFRPSPDRQSREDTTAVDWQSAFATLGLPPSNLAQIRVRAALAGVTIQRQIVISGLVGEDALVRYLAVLFSIRFLQSMPANAIGLTPEQSLAFLSGRSVNPVLQLGEEGACPLIVFTFDNLDLNRFQRFIRDHGSIAPRLCCTTGSVMSAALRQQAEPALLDRAIHGLKRDQPDFSAASRITQNQSTALLLGILCLFLGLVLWPVIMMHLLHIALLFCFFSGSALRLVAGLTLPNHGASIPVLHKDDCHHMPVYTVLIALYREAEIVPDLLRALDRLIWPRDRLEIKLVCEADDGATLAALRAIPLRLNVDVIEVPNAQPRTKPKALSYSLPLVRGEFVVIYDAEDRPHPFQLLEAWQRFSVNDRMLACLQAPLVVTNDGASWLSRMFAFEYAALFQGILPLLSRLGLVIPLGGTSNHFRADILREVGAWDPFNVTEDADLGIRLFRQGYRIETLVAPTYEEAPIRFTSWLCQRSRWFKGWMQTWLVHMRSPLRLLADTGPASFLMVQVLVPCMLISALCNIFLNCTIIVVAAVYAMTGAVLVSWEPVRGVDIAIIVLGYMSFLALGWWTLPVGRQRRLWLYMLLIAPYWLCLSLAAWRALWQLFTAPFQWEKTHHPSRTGHAISNVP